MKNVFLIVVTFMFSWVSAQNLVLNPSFETFAPCPVGPGEFTNTQNWDDANSGADSTSSPDLYAACSWQIGGVNSPAALLGYQPSRTGFAHAGIINYEAVSLFGCVQLFSDNYREYIRGELSSPLQAGTQYDVSFYVNLANNAKFAVSNMGVYFSTTAVSQNFGTQPGPMQQTPQLTYNGVLLDDTAQWKLLTWNYTATGGEQYFVIGNFDNDNGTNDQCVNANSFFPYAYYFIDDVSVVALTSAAPIVNFAASDSVFCEKQSIDFTDLSTNNPTTWQWTFAGANPATSTMQNPAGIYYPTYGTFAVSLVACNAAGCDSLFYNTFITELQSPPTPTVTVNGSLLCASAAANYAWYETSNLSLILSTLQCYQPTMPGNYFVIVSDSNGCSTPSASVAITSVQNNFSTDCIAINKLGTNIFEIKNNCSHQNISCTIMDVTGKIIDVFETNDKHVFNLQNVSTGIYFLKYNAKEMSGVVKMAVY